MADLTIDLHINIISNLLFVQDKSHRNKPNTNRTTVDNLKPSMSNTEDKSKEAPRFVMGARATDTARLMKFTKVLGGTTVILGTQNVTQSIFLILFDFFKYGRYSMNAKNI